MQFVANVARAGQGRAMALEHALLVALCERPASGLELARRFDRSFGYFWSATHQQIYKVLRRMEADGWVSSDVVREPGRRERTVYTVTTAGTGALASWLAEPTPPESFRSDLAVKLRGASYGERSALLADIEERVGEHRVRLAHYESLRERDYPHPDRLTGQQLDQYLVLRGGVLMEQLWVTWLTEYLEAHRG
jgi:DNA-binding PadR family transcriptional regulator